jgi:hypothetical protein
MTEACHKFAFIYKFAQMIYSDFRGSFYFFPENRMFF